MPLQRRGVATAVVKIGKTIAQPLPSVKTLIGHQYVPYETLVKRVTPLARSEGVTSRLIADLLDKTHFNPEDYCYTPKTIRRPLFVGVGTDLSSVTLALVVQRWLATTRFPIRVRPLIVKLPGDRAMLEFLPALQKLLETFDLSPRIVIPTLTDALNVAAPHANLPEGQEWLDSFARHNLSPSHYLTKRLRWWVLYKAIKEVEPSFTTALLAGTTLDRNLQKIAAALDPDPPLQPRLSLPFELEGLSIQSSPLQLPVLDTVSTNHHFGRIKVHRPFLPIDGEGVERTLEKLEVTSVQKVLQSTPPVFRRLAPLHSEQMLRLVRQCHTITRHVKRVASEFVSASCKVDYRLGWATIDSHAFRKLDINAARMVVGALAAFASGESHENWLARPGEGIKHIVDVMQGTVDSLPTSPIVPIDGTGADLVFGTPYHPALSATPHTFSILPGKSLRAPPITRFSEFIPQTYIHERCAASAVMGRVVVNIFVHTKVAKVLESQKAVFWCMPLRHPDDPWWEQVTNGKEFTKQLRKTIHSDQDSPSNPTKPTWNLLRFSPLVLEGRPDGPPPSAEGDPIPPPTHLKVVACPQLSLWSPGVFPQRVWKPGSRLLNRVTVFLLRPQWVNDFLPAPGLVGPIFLPPSQQLRHLTGSYISAKDRATRRLHPDLDLDPAQYDKIKASVVARVGDNAQVSRAKVDILFDAETLRGGRKRGETRDPEVWSSLPVDNEVLGMRAQEKDKAKESENEEEGLSAWFSIGEEEEKSGSNQEAQQPPARTFGKIFRRRKWRK
eukprot:Sspe_Gene.50833::Locus_28254_Transcript_1_1_Confidence_1.000_Length_2471::g.50833::m.50833